MKINLIVFVLLVLFSSCKNEKREDVSKAETILDSFGSSEVNQNKNVIVENNGDTHLTSKNTALDKQFQKIEHFDEFLSRFIKDSVFRYNRIKFPMVGFNSDSETSSDNYVWTREDWAFYFEEDKNHEKNENIISEILVEKTRANWRLYIKDSGYDVTYQFELNTNIWYLTSYSHKNF